MVQFTFEQRVAVISGAGRGLGRAYARLLAERGASVVVNDVGGSNQGDGASADPALDVVAEIVAAGGRAIADTHDISTEGGADAVINAAVSNFGRIDILINNAGIMRWAGLPDVDLDNLQRHIAVHLYGSFNLTRAAWPHFVQRQYGRIIFTTSTAVFGIKKGLSYAAAKGGVIGLARSVSRAGEPHDIKVNMIAPVAKTRLAGEGAPDHSAALQSLMAPEAAAPLVGLLAHEKCPTSGEIYTAGAGRFARLFVASTQGYVPSDVASIEDVADNWNAINDPTDYHVPTDVGDWTRAHTKHVS